ncbi:MAG: hypothetical protein KIC66_09940 [Clostridium sp.]|uniref:Uncharacterized protein n=1 Tax=Clostridium paraputrificum TaxID=29363 RepID=A0A6N2YZB8_9CLOT|nr:MULTISPECIES: hypothetical protein [Clostridium]MBS5927390.1 hypothetical protein [Clostridium sp.]MBS5987293.1 hypothetical protein [Clostridium sp.]MDB2104749.1 hypothetical protein [Clostridium paraputrificum]MDC0803348.1 hypothetical protein [Clostridium paraputrificum]
MKELKNLSKEKFYGITNIFEDQMSKISNKILLLLFNLISGLILFLPYKQSENIIGGEILKVLLYLIIGVYLLGAVFSIILILMVLIKKNVDRLINLSVVSGTIIFTLSLLITYITNIVYEGYLDIFWIIALISFILTYVGILIYNNKIKRRLIDGYYIKENYRYKFNPRYLLFILPLVPMLIPIANKGKYITEVFGTLYYLLGLNYGIILITAVLGVFALKRMYYVYQINNVKRV